MKDDECFFCGEDGALDQHHIVPKRHGGSDKDDNLVTLCPTCHAKIERELYNKEFYEKISDSLGESSDQTTIDDSQQKLEDKKQDKQTSDESEESEPSEPVTPLAALVLGKVKTEVKLASGDMAKVALDDIKRHANHDALSVPGEIFTSKRIVKVLRDYGILYNDEQKYRGSNGYTVVEVYEDDIHSAYHKLDVERILGDDAKQVIEA